MLYSLNGNYPQPLPFRIRLPDGSTRTEPYTFTPEDILSAGYIQVNDEPIPTDTQIVKWSSSTLSWIVRDKTPEELQAELTSAKNERLTYITQCRDDDFNSLTTVWNNHTWDARETDSTRIANVLTMIEQANQQGIPTPPNVDWRTYDDQSRTLTVAELTQLGASMFQAQQVIWYKQAMLKDQILAATTIDEVNSITW
jgi:hypothetical protein